MARITSSVGLVSGINSQQVIDQLMNLEARGKTRIQARIDAASAKRLAYTELQTRLTAIKLSGTTLKKPSTFQATTTTSSDENVLTATTGANAAVGSYQFQVARLATTQQIVGGGFADFDAAPVGAGTLTIERGGGELTSDNPLSELNGGAGVRRGSFRVTDRSGASAVVELGASVTLEDVLRKINTNLEVRVRASLDGDRIVLTDLTGKTDSDLIVQDIGTGKAAADLGLAGSVAASTLTGTRINQLGSATLLASLNDGRGVRTGTSGNDLTIDPGDGGALIQVQVRGKGTLGEVISSINTAGAGRVRAEVGPDGNNLQIVSLGGSSVTVAAVGTSKAAQDLGILGTSAGTTLSGTVIRAPLGTVLTSSLLGGAGLPLGVISIKSRAAGSATTVSLTGATTVAEIIDRINSAVGPGVQASLKSSGNGIQLVDRSGGTSDLVVADVSGTSAVTLGLAGTYGLDVESVQGANLQRAWVTENTTLASYNGGNGVSRGRFRITDSLGATSVVDLSQGNEVRLADVISEINSRPVGVTARINDNGDGLLIEDTAGGAGKLKIEDLDGTSARDLNIAGTAATTFINGSLEKTVTISATDSLDEVQKKINDLNFGVQASIINDGTGDTPYRLSITARSPGRAGRVVFDAGATRLGTRTLVSAQDAVVFLGGADVEQPLVVTSSRNQIAGVVRGVNLELNGVSDRPVTLNVTASVDAAAAEMRKFADNFNGLVDKLKELTKFDSATNTRGVLLGEAAASTVQTEVYAFMQSVVTSAGRFKIPSDVGLRVGEGARVEFDEAKFREAFATDQEAVVGLFTRLETVQKPGGGEEQVGRGLGFLLEKRVERLIAPVTGVIPRENKALDDRTLGFQQRIRQMDELLARKRTRLERQFAQLESVLSNLQSQQSSLSQIQTIRMPNRS